MDGGLLFERLGPIAHSKRGVDEVGRSQLFLGGTAEFPGSLGGEHRVVYFIYLLIIPLGHLIGIGIENEIRVRMTFCS